MDIFELKTKCVEKLNKTANRVKDDIPYTTVGGKFDDWSERDKVVWWTNSFWSGILWELYDETGNEDYKIWAGGVEAKLSDVLHNRYECLDHDLGFLWLLTGVDSYKRTQNPKSKNDALLAASILASRFNIKGNFIRAWNNWGPIVNEGKAIIDCMMNLPLLYWAAKETGNNNLRDIAMAHADTVIKHFQRPDGSTKHIVCFDPKTGEYVGEEGGQGYCEGSSWTRGQGWIIYGMVQSYQWTKEARYLDSAKKAADYFIEESEKYGYKIPCDFAQPDNDEIYDSSAAAIAASGMVEIYRETKDKKYFDGAKKLIEACDKFFCPWDDENDEALMNFGCLRYSEPEQIALIYGDYYFFHAVRAICNLS